VLESIVCEWLVWPEGWCSKGESSGVCSMNTSARVSFFLAAFTRGLGTKFTIKFMRHESRAGGIFEFTKLAAKRGCQIIQDLEGEISVQPQFHQGMPMHKSKEKT
jgi:hypothetical protein